MLRNFWHLFAEKFLPIKKEIIDLTKKIKKQLFRSSKNILGVLTRGTDYTARKPREHPIPPNITDLIKDVKEMDVKYKYDYIFFSTEDDNIRDQFTSAFADKVKLLKQKIRINYDYIKKD